MRCRITKELIQSGEGSRNIWDTEVKGLGVRITAAGAKTWTLKYWSRPLQKQRWYSLGSCDNVSPTQARKKARALLVGIADGSDPAEERKRIKDAGTINDLLDRYIREHLEVKNKPSTRAPVKYMIEGHLRPAFGRMKIETVTRSDISRLHAKMVSTPRAGNHALAVLSKVFNLAEIWGLRPENSNPVRLIQRYREQPRDRFITEGEINQLGKALDSATGLSPWAVGAIRFLMFSGMRKSEAISLEWNWVEFEAGYVRLPDAKAGGRIQSLSDTALNVLRSIPRGEETPWIFLGADGNRALPVAGIDGAWKSVRKAAKLEDVRLHDLRHLVGTCAGEAGANAFAVRDLLGHKGLAMTNRYVSRNVAPTRQLANLVADRINAALNA
ncbi:MAG: site-specific integrase [Proteobacteria bacterium]|nr:site-specific integrase [Pseudomonadota bacterium]